MFFHIGLISFITVLAALFFSKGENRLSKQLYLFFVFSILLFLSSFRSINIGNDTATYVNLYYLFGSWEDLISENVLLSSNFYSESRIEIGYILLNKFLYNLSSDYAMLFFGTSLLILSIWIIFIYKHSTLVWLSIFLFINLRLFYFTLSGLRQAIAMALILVSYKFLIERKFIYFAIIVFCASLFHLSALVFLIIYPLSKIKLNKKILINSSIIGIVSFIFFDLIINSFLIIFPKYSMYLTSTYFDGNVRLASIMNFLVIFIIFIAGYTLNNSEKITRDNSEINVLNHIILLGTIITFVSINASIVNRFSMYFFMFVVIYMPKIITNISNRNLRLTSLYFITIFSLLYNIVILYYRPEWQNLYPFEFYWED